MDWHERTERQVGARGVDELRQWMALSAATDAAARPRHALATSMLVLVLAMVAALVLGPTTGVASAAPLPPGTYAAAVEGGTVTVTVHDDGGAEVIASDGLVVRLSFDAAGRVLDAFLVETSEGPVTVEVEVDADGYEVITSGGDLVPGRTIDAFDESGTDRDAVLGVVAACAPHGAEARALGLPNRGSILSAAASGLSLEVELGGAGQTGRRTVHTQLATLAGAREFCDLVAGVDDSRGGPGPRGDGSAAVTGDAPGSSAAADARSTPGAGQSRGRGAPDRTGTAADATSDSRDGPQDRRPSPQERATEPERSGPPDARTRPDPAEGSATPRTGTQSEADVGDPGPSGPTATAPSSGRTDRTPPGHEQRSSPTARVPLDEAIGNAPDAGSGDP